MDARKPRLAQHTEPDSVRPKKPTADATPHQLHVAGRDGDPSEGARLAPAHHRSPSASKPGDEEEFGLSLEELGQTYAQMLGQGELPYQQSNANEIPAAAEATTFDPVSDELVEDDHCPITPLSILEAVLFVGRPGSEPIEAELVAGMMRGVRSAEIEQLVAELNDIYAKEGHVLRIVASGEGFRMQLADEFSNISDRFYGSVREIKLTQAAIDCLAIIAYRPGVTREELEQQRGQSSGTILTQLVRRQLIEMRREGVKKERTRRYYPTKRMLKLAGMEALEELPLAEDFER